MAGIIVVDSIGTPQSFIPVVAAAEAPKLGAVSQTFASVAALKAAADIERANIGIGFQIWTAGQQLGVADEVAQGVVRVWDAAAEHSRTAIIRPGLAVTLATDDNVILFGAVPPAVGQGVNGDVFVDWTGGSYYTKGAGAWTLTGVVYAAGSGGAVSSVAGRTGAVTLTAGDLADLKTVAGASLVGAGDIPGLSPVDVAKATAQLAAPTSIDANYTFTAADDGHSFYVTGPFTLTVPAGLGWDEGVHVQMPASDTVAWDVMGATTINGLTSATRTRANNPAGVILCPVAGEIDAYGLTDSALASVPTSSPDGQTYVQPVNGQMNFLVDGAPVGSVTLVAGVPKWTLDGILDPAAYVGTPLTFAQRDALVAASPLSKIGYLVNVVDTGVSEYQRWDGAAWVALGGAAVAPTTFAALTDAATAELDTLNVPLSLALAGKVETTIAVSAGNGLTGGGDLSTNRTLSVLLDPASDAALTVGAGGVKLTLPAAVEPATAAPLAAGSASAGAAAAYAREDHVHPSETDGPAAAAPLMDGTAAVGASDKFAREDHVHPTDTALVPLSTVTAKGDLIAGSAAGAVTRLAVGSDGQVLLADSAEATGLKWATLGSLTTTPLTASTALPEATGSGAAFLYEVGSATTIELTAPSGTVGGVAAFVASNHGAGAKLLVSDSAAGEWDVAQVGAPTSGAYQTQTETLTYAASAVEAVSYTHGDTQGSAGATVDFGTVSISRHYIGNGQARVEIEGFTPYWGVDPSVTLTLPTGYLTSGTWGIIDRNDLNTTTWVVIGFPAADQITFNRDDGITGDSPFRWKVSGIGKWVGDRPSATVLAGSVVPTPLAFSHARASASQTVADSTNVLVAINTAVSDASALLVAGTNRIVAASAGVYRIRGVVPWSTSGNPGIQAATILVNGVGVKSSSTRNNQPMAVTQVETTLTLAAGDYVQLQARQETGASLSTAISAANLANVYPELEVRQLPSSTVVDPDAVPVVDLAWGQNYWSSFGSMTNTSSAIAVVATASRATLAPASQRIPMIGTGNPASGVFTGSGITRDTANNRFVIQTGGRYSVTADTIGGWMGGVEHGIQLVLNGATVLAISTAHVSGATFGVGTNISWEGLLAANDTLELRAFVQGAGTPYYFEGGTFIVAQQPSHSIVKYTPGDVEVLNLHYGSISGASSFTATANAVFPVSAWTTNGASFGLTVSEAAGTITIVQAGTYRVVASAMARSVSSNAANSVAIAKNGVVVYTSPEYLAGNAGTYPLPMRAEEVLTLAAGDVITAFAGPTLSTTAWGTPYLSVSQEPVGMLVDPGSVPVLTLHSATLSAKNVTPSTAVYTIPAGTSWTAAFATATTFPIGAQATLVEDPNGLRIGDTFVVQQAGDYDFEFRFINGFVGDAITWFLAVDGVERNKWSIDAGPGLTPGTDGHPSSLGYRLRGLTAGQVVTLRHHNNTTAIDLDSWDVSLSQVPAHSIVAYTPGDVVVENLMSGQTADTAITANQTTSSTAYVDVAGGSVTLPAAGTYEIEYSVHVNNGTVGAVVNTAITDSANNIIAGSIVGMGEANGAGAAGPSRSRVEVTVIAAGSYKLRWKVSSGSATLYNDASSGSSWMRYRQLPTGVLVDPGTVPVEELTWAHANWKPNNNDGSGGPWNASGVSTVAQTISGTGARFPLATGTKTGSGITVDLANNQYVITKAGRYNIQCEASAYRLNGGSGVQLILNNTTMLNAGSVYNGTTLNVGATATATWEGMLAVGDRIDGRVWNATSVLASALTITQLSTHSVINTTDVAVNDQATSGYFDTGTKRECWGTAVTTGVGTLAITLPGGGFANAGYAFFPSSSLEGFDARETLPAKTVTVVNVKTVNLNSTTLAGNVPFSWFAVGTKP